MGKTKIEWTKSADGTYGRVWNPLRGCSKVSEGCRNCYAIRQAHRFSGPGMPYEGLTLSTEHGPNWTGKVMLVPKMLGEPFKWKEPQRVFVNSMSDLFHDAVPDEYIAEVFGIMWLALKHTFMILTKRPERMNRLLNDEDFKFRTGWYASQAVRENGIKRPDNLPDWPNPNIWLGVSVENQKAADERIPLLLQTPAAVRFLSCEPLLGPVDLDFSAQFEHPDNEGYGVEAIKGLDLIITGGESGPNARPSHPDWFRSIRDQCQAAGVAFHFKQWGEWAPEDNFPDHIPSGKSYGFTNETVWRVGKNKAGRMLDGRTWDEMPSTQG